MSELHTYRLLHVDLRTGLHTGRALERAFSAADAVTQFRAKNPAESVGPVFEIEPLPDAPTPQQAQADTPRREWTTIPVGEKSPKPETGTARAATPDDCIKALEAALRERTAERDRLRKERDAMVCAAVGQDPRLGVSVVDVERVVRDLGDLRARDKNRLDALDEIADLAWPGTSRPFAYALAPLVEAVRKMVAERDRLRADAAAALQREQDAHDKYVRSLTLSRDAAAGERDALQKRIDGIAETLGDTTTDAVQRVSRALFLLRGHDTHSLQKRIDAAKAWISDRPWNAARGASFDALLAILEDRAPESAEPASSKAGRWRCKRCGVEVVIPACAETDTSLLENASGKWEWSHSQFHGEDRWKHWCQNGCSGAHWSERIEVGAP